MEIFQLMAVLAAALAGAATYINTAAHPARMECGKALASAVFGPKLPKGCGDAGSACGCCDDHVIGAWLTGGGAYWLAGSIAIFAVVPFTLLAIRPTNNRLLDPTIDRGSDRTRSLLQLWGRLHGVRTILSLASSILFLASLVWGSK